MVIFSKPRLVILFLALIFLTCTISPTFVAAASKPQVTDNVVSKLQNVSVQLNGYVNPGGLNTSYRFRYGTSTAYGKSTSPLDIGAGTTWIDVNSGLFLLSSNTTYYYRLEASNSVGTTYGNTRSFRTYSSPQNNAKPTITTGVVYKVTSASGVLSGTINSNGDNTTWFFKYGKTNDYGSTTEFKSIVGSREPISVSITISSLEDGSTYHYCLCGYNNEGLTNGSDKTFTTFPIAEVLPLPTNKTSFPFYQPVVTATTGIDPSLCKPVGVGSIAEDGETVAVEIKLENPSGLYDAYLALNPPVLDTNEYFMLGKDGIFHPFSQSGLVKWKQAATGKIDEKPFGEFPASLLPGGVYNFNFMLTEAGSLDAYYLWQTSFSAPETQIDVPDGSAGFFNGTLVVPNAEILSGGQLYENSASISDNSLTTIKKNGEIYFYHPAMNQVELSENNSRLAVAYFMTGLSTSEIKKIQRESARVPVNLSNVGDKVSLDTGVDITLVDNEGLVEAKNTRIRFAAVKTGEQPEDKSWMLPRVSFAIPTDLREFVSFVKTYAEYAADGFNSSDLDSNPAYVSASDKIETFGAFLRLSAPARNGAFTQVQQEAIGKDKELVASLNAVDTAYYLLEGIRHVYSLTIPSDCARVLTNYLCRHLQTMITGLLSGDENIVWDLTKVNIEGGVFDAMECAAQSLLVPTVVGAVAKEAVSKYLSIISLAQWAYDDKYEAFMAQWGAINAYDLAVIGASDTFAYLQRDFSSGTVTEIVQDEDDNIWSVPVIAIPDGAEHRIVAMTPNGVVLSLWNNAHPDKFFTTTDWGRGQQTDIYAALGATNGPFDFQGSECLDITDSGRLFFKYGDQYDKDGIYTIMANGTDGHFVPIVINQAEFDGSGFDTIYPDALAVSGDGKVLVFSQDDFYVYHDHNARLYSVDPSGENLQILTSSNDDIDRIYVSHSGEMILFDYTTPEDKTVLCTVSSNGGTVVNLTDVSNLTLFHSTVDISPDGNWVAAVAGSIQDNTIGIAFIRTDGSSYHWMDLGSEGIQPSSSLPLSFNLSSKTVAFCGYDETGARKLFDIFAVDI